MEWKEEYELGFTEIDKQHNTLIDCVNKYKSNLSEKNSKKIMSTLQFLVNYANHHFQAEENLMQSIAYPNLKEHSEIHKNIVSQLRDKILAFKTSGIHINLELYYFLESWVNDHILLEDMKIKKFCKKNKIQMKKAEQLFISISDTVDKVQKELDFINNEISDKNIMEEDRDFRRIIILQEYFEDIFPKDPVKVKEVLRAMIELINTHIISTEELNILNTHLSIDSLFKKFESKEMSHIIKDEVNIIKDKIKL